MATTTAQQALFDRIKVRSMVTIRNRFDQTHRGRAVLRGPAGWVCNMGGRFGTPGIATPENVVAVDAERLCDYCEEAPATGYVKAYRAHVCEPCFDDHHG